MSLIVAETPLIPRSVACAKWPRVSVGKLLIETRNGLYKPDSFYGRGTRILKMFNIGRLDGTWKLSRVDKVEISEHERGQYELSEGDILFNRVNSRELVGKCAVVDETTAGAVFESKNIRVTVDRSRVEPWWLVAWINAKAGRKQIETRAKQAVGQATLNRADFDQIEIPLPPLAEQQRIAARLREQLAAAETARKAVAAQLAAARALRTAMLRAVFESAGAQQWPQSPLSDIIASSRNGLYKSDKFYGRGTRILKMFNLGRLDGSWVLDRVDMVELTAGEKADFALHKGDILLNRVNSRELVGKCAVVREATAGAVFESKNIRLRLRTDLAEPQWVATALNAPRGRAQIEARTKQIIGMATLNHGDFAHLLIPLPPLAEQRIIAARLDAELAATAALRATLESRLNDLEKLPATLLREAFGGNEG